MTAHPRLRHFTLATGLRCEIDVIVGCVEDVDAAPVRRVRVEHRAVVSLVEDAYAGRLALLESLHGIVIVGRFGVNLGPRERYAEVAVEVVIERRQPTKVPAHTFAIVL